MKYLVRIQLNKDCVTANEEIDWTHETEGPKYYMRLISGSGYDDPLCEYELETTDSAKEIKTTLNDFFERWYGLENCKVVNVVPQTKFPMLASLFGSRKEVGV